MSQAAEQYRISNACEIIPGRLFFLIVKELPREDDHRDCHFFTVDRVYSYVKYVLLYLVDTFIPFISFCDDFGPLNLSCTYRFCQRMREKLKAEELAHKKIYLCTGTNTGTRSNIAAMLGAFAIIYLGKTADEAFEMFANYAEKGVFRAFRDAAWCRPIMTLTILDVLRGVYQALLNGFLDFTNFDPDEYEYFEQVKNGDLNWIVPGKFIAFAGPHNESHVENGYQFLCPEHYVPYFQRNNVTDVIRLNKKLYEREKFVDSGIKHWDLFFTDGTTPPHSICQQFLKICEEAKGAVAVHCKAGIGRTGTLIGCYLMKHHRMTAPEAIAWMRITRPGCVIGPQQIYMLRMLQELWQEGLKIGAVRKTEADRPRWAQPIADAAIREPTTPKLEPVPSIKVPRSIAPELVAISASSSTPPFDSGEEIIPIQDSTLTQGDVLTHNKAMSQAHHAPCGSESQLAAITIAPHTPATPVQAQSELPHLESEAVRNLGFSNRFLH